MRNVIVTGGSRGLGLGIVKKLTGEGYRAIAIARKSNGQLAAAMEVAQRRQPSQHTANQVLKRQHRLNAAAGADARRRLEADRQATAATPARRLFLEEGLQLPILPEVDPHLDVPAPKPDRVAGVADGPPPDVADVSARKMFRP